MRRLGAAALLAVLALAVFPGVAHAWTPGTHIFLGESVLANLHQLPAAVTDLLRVFPYDFLYGNIAADTSIAKKYAPVGRHCHAWHVGQEIFDLAPTDPLRAFGLGYLSHLAADAVARGHEGVMVKADDAAYELGRRGSGWVKVKPVHTLDLVILAVERGNGRRRQWLSNLHLGALDPEGRYGPRGGFVMLGKTFKGLTDEMLRWQSAELPRHADGPTDGYVIRLRPEVVVEIAFDGVQTSPRYPAGLALRFARVVRHRPDKAAVEADTIAMVEALRQP